MTTRDHLPDQIERLKRERDRAPKNSDRRVILQDRLVALRIKQLRDEVRKAKRKA